MMKFILNSLKPLILKAFKELHIVILCNFYCILTIFCLMICGICCIILNIERWLITWIFLDYKL